MEFSQELKDQIKDNMLYITITMKKKPRNFLNKILQDAVCNYFLENYVAHFLKQDYNSMSGREIRKRIQNKLPSEGKKYIKLLDAFKKEIIRVGKGQEYRIMLSNIIQEEEIFDIKSTGWCTLQRKKIVALLLIVHWEEENILNFYDMWNCLFPSDPLIKMKMSTQEKEKQKETKRKLKKSKKENNSVVKITPSEVLDKCQLLINSEQQQISDSNEQLQICNQQAFSQFDLKQSDQLFELPEDHITFQASVCKLSQISKVPEHNTSFVQQINDCNNKKYQLDQISEQSFSSQKQTNFFSHSSEQFVDYNMNLQQIYEEDNIGIVNHGVQSHIGFPKQQVFYDNQNRTNTISNQNSCRDYSEIHSQQASTSYFQEDQNNSSSSQRRKIYDQNNNESNGFNNILRPRLELQNLIENRPNNLSESYFNQEFKDQSLFFYSKTQTEDYHDCQHLEETDTYLSFYHENNEILQNQYPLIHKRPNNLSVCLSLDSNMHSMY